VSGHYSIVCWYLGGIEQFKAPDRRSVEWSLHYLPDRLEVWRRSPPPVMSFTRFASDRVLAATHPWGEVTHVTYEDPGVAGQRANLAALAAFGVLAVGSRLPTTVVTVGLASGHEMFFRVGRDLATHRARLSSLPELAEAPMRFGGQLAPPTSAAPAVGSDVAGQLERLASLHAQGVLSGGEFAAAKARLLG